MSDSGAKTPSFIAVRLVFIHAEYGTYQLLSKERSTAEENLVLARQALATLTGLSYDDLFGKRALFARGRSNTIEYVDIHTIAAVENEEEIDGKG